MKICGIVCEYNPFHNGHIHHIQETKKALQPDVLICVMSSNFVQRGEPAIINKWERAKQALQHGVDIVIELPFIYSTQSADHFCAASVHLLTLAGVKDIVFGSECNDIQKLYALASQDFALNTKKTSTMKAFSEQFGDITPNDILGIQYIKNCLKVNIQAHCIKRTNNYHDEHFAHTFSSASAIRKACFDQVDYTNETPMHDLETTFQLKNYYPLIKFLLQTLSSDVLSKLFLMDEGMQHRLCKISKQTSDFETFLTLCTSKKYTKSRVRRSLIHLLNQTTKEEVNTLPLCSHLRILAFNENGKSYLRELQDMDVHIASKFAQIPSPFREMEYKSSQVYASVLPLDQQETFMQLELQPPIYKK